MWYWSSQRHHPVDDREVGGQGREIEGLLEKGANGRQPGSAGRLEILDQLAHLRAARLPGIGHALVVVLVPLRDRIAAVFAQRPFVGVAVGPLVPAPADRFEQIALRPLAEGAPDEVVVHVLDSLHVVEIEPAHEEARVLRTGGRDTGPLEQRVPDEGIEAVAPLAQLVQGEAALAVEAPVTRKLDRPAEGPGPAGGAIGPGSVASMKAETMPPKAAGSTTFLIVSDFVAPIP